MWPCHQCTSSPSLYWHTSETLPAATKVVCRHHWQAEVVISCFQIEHQQRWILRNHNPSFMNPEWHDTDNDMLLLIRTAAYIMYSSMHVYNFLMHSSIISTSYVVYHGRGRLAGCMHYILCSCSAWIEGNYFYTIQYKYSTFIKYKFKMSKKRIL